MYPKHPCVSYLAIGTGSTASSELGITIFKKSLHTMLKLLVESQLLRLHAVRIICCGIRLSHDMGMVSLADSLYCEGGLVAGA